MFASLVQILFKSKEHSLPVIEKAVRQLKFFNVPVPKHYKHEFYSLIKNKEFLAVVKEKLYLHISKLVNKLNNVNEATLVR